MDWCGQGVKLTCPCATGTVLRVRQGGGSFAAHVHGYSVYCPRAKPLCNSNRGKVYPTFLRRRVPSAEALDASMETSPASREAVLGVSGT